MTQTLIEQPQELPRFNIFKLGISAAMVEQENGKYVNIDDLRAVIEQHKRESGDDSCQSAKRLSAEDIKQLWLTRTYSGFSDDPENWQVFANAVMDKMLEPQPSHIKLIGELVQALEPIGQRFVSGNDVPVSRATVPAEEWQAVQELVAKAREAVKHE